MPFGKRWQDFSSEELETIRGALADSSGMRSSTPWYWRCTALKNEVDIVRLGRIVPPQDSIASSDDGLDKASTPGDEG